MLKLRGLEHRLDDLAAEEPDGDGDSADEPAIVSPAARDHPPDEREYN